MSKVRLCACVCACLPVFASAEIVLEEPVPAPPAPVAPAEAPTPAGRKAPPPARPIRREAQAAEAPEMPPRVSAGPFSDRIQLKDGSERVGDCVVASAAGVGVRRRAFPRPVILPWEQVVRIQFNQTVPKAGVSEPHMVAFTNGDKLPGQVIELAGDRVVVATWFAGKVEAKLAAVQQLGAIEPKPMDPLKARDMAMKAVEEARTPQERARGMAQYEAADRAINHPVKPSKPPEAPAPGMCLMILANGDKIECSKFVIRDGKAQVDTAAGPVEIPSVRIRTCLWVAAAEMPPLPPPGTRTVRFNGPLGGHVLLRIEKIADGKLVGTHEALGKLEIALDAVAVIE